MKLVRSHRRGWPETKVMPCGSSLVRTWRLQQLTAGRSACGIDLTGRCGTTLFSSWLTRRCHAGARLAFCLFSVLSGVFAGVSGPSLFFSFVRLTGVHSGFLQPSTAVVLSIGFVITAGPRWSGRAGRFTVTGSVQTPWLAFQKNVWSRALPVAIG